MTPRLPHPRHGLATVVLLLTTPWLHAETTPVALGKAEDTRTLSPFTVSTEKDTDYLASGTLGGSRLNTSLLDTPASISVMTRDFLTEIAATSVGDLNDIDPILSNGDTRENLLVRESARVLGRHVQFQVNLDNVLNVNDPIVADADVNGASRFLHPNPFRWTLLATTSF